MSINQKPLTVKHFLKKNKNILKGFSNVFFCLCYLASASPIILLFTVILDTVTTPFVVLLNSAIPFSGITPVLHLQFSLVLVVLIAILLFPAFFPQVFDE